MTTYAIRQKGQENDGTRENMALGDLHLMTPLISFGALIFLYIFCHTVVLILFYFSCLFCLVFLACFFCFLLVYAHSILPHGVLIYIAFWLTLDWLIWHILSILLYSFTSILDPFIYLLSILGLVFPFIWRRYDSHSIHPFHSISFQIISHSRSWGS